MLTHVVLESDNSNSVFYYIPNFLDKSDTTELKQYLDSQQFIPSHGFSKEISRTQKWIHFDGKYFCSEWKIKYPQWYSSNPDKTILDITQKIQDFVEKIYDIPIPRINSCLINKYDCGNNFIALHRDSILSFGESPTIIGLSVGAERKIDFVHNEDHNKNFSFVLESGSIFIMAESSQKFYKHEIKKESHSDVRYSLTFREHIL